jgi:hypothetical protein
VLNAINPANNKYFTSMYVNDSYAVIQGALKWIVGGSTYVLGVT